MKIKQSDYQTFLKSKRVTAPKSGFSVGKDDLNANLFPWQKDLVQWSLKLGKAALFEDCGLGKTIQQLEWSKWVAQITGKPVLILAPILVGWQTVEEASKFSIDAPVRYCREPGEIGPGINITNYERIHKFDSKVFGGVVLDESSILKNYMGVRKRAIIDMFKGTPYKLSCTATPAPNDLLEIGNQADFLDVMPSNEMIARWFIADSMHAGCYRLRKHGAVDFWRWVSSWAVSLSSPADLGFDNDGFNLPPLEIKEKVVAAGLSWFGDESKSNASATRIHDEKRASLQRRCQAVAELTNDSREQWVVWCGTNYESDVLKEILTDCVEVRGSDTEAKKEKALKDFQHGEKRVIITKPEIGGFGLNWQHCHNMTWFASYSFEKFYQAVRRLYRFGQKHRVNVHIVASEQELCIVDANRKKALAHEGMKSEVADSMKDFQISEIYGRKLEEYKTCQKVELPTWLKGQSTKAAERNGHSIEAMPAK